MLGNNAAVQDFPLDQWDAIIAINLTAFVATRAAQPGMLDRGWGRIINVASTTRRGASARKLAHVTAQ